MSYHLIVAIDNKSGIGKNGKIPWNCKEDLKHFSKITTGSGNNAIIMGKNTWESIGSKCLPNRVNIVLSTSLKKNKSTNPDYIFNNINDLINYCKSLDHDNYWIIGGQEIYKSFLEKDICTSCYITKIENNYNCDRTFPIDMCYNKMILDSVTKLYTDLKYETRIFKYINNNKILDELI